MTITRNQSELNALIVHVLYTGENIEELFTRVAVVAFENVLMKEVEAEAAPPPSNGQLAKNSMLIGKAIIS